MKYSLSILVVILLGSLSVRGDVPVDPSLPTSETIIVGGLDGIDPLSSDSLIEIGLALSGGGARGVSAIGVLRAFEEKDIRVIAIAGTSIGGLVGGLYACGYSPTQLDSIVEVVQKTNLFSNRPARTTMFLAQRQARERHLASIRFAGLKPVLPKGLMAAQELTALLFRLTVKPNYLSGGDFGKLPVPFRTICTDIVTGDKVVVTQGSLADAIRSTIAFPLAFTGVEQGDQLLMDGGMVTPVPVEDVKAMVPPGRLIVAVNSTSPLVPREELITAIDIASQATSIMTRDKMVYQLAQADLVVTPDIGWGSLTDIKNSDKFIEAGYAAGLAAADSLRKTQSLFEAGRLINVTSLVPASDEPEETATQRAVEFLSHKVDSHPISRRQLIATAKAALRSLDLFELKLKLVSLAADSTQPDRWSLIVVGVPLPEAADLSFEVHGNLTFPDSELVSLFRPENNWVSPADIRQTRQAIIDKYEEHGYDVVKITGTTLDHTNRHLEMTIDEGIINRIQVKNNDQSKDWLVKSYFPLSPGQPYSTRGAAKGLANVYGSDLFERVNLDLTPSDSGVIVTIIVTEKKYTQVRLGWHWHDVYQSEEFIELLNDNLFGTGTEYLLHAKLGYDRQSYWGQVRADRIFSTLLTSRARIFLDKIERTAYGPGLIRRGIRDERRWGGELQIGQNFARWGTLTALVSAEELEYRSNYSDIIRRFGMRTLTFESLVESFDRATFPETGKKHLFRLSFAGLTEGGDIEVFTRYYNSIESYFPLGKGLNYHPRLVIGLSRTGLPESEKFFLGGLGSFSGLREHQLTGDKVFAINQELRLKLPWHFYVLGCYDLGEVYASTDEIKINRLQHGWGISLALDTPLGPFEFNYGKYELTPGIYSFRAGFDF